MFRKFFNLFLAKIFFKVFLVIFILVILAGIFKFNNFINYFYPIFDYISDSYDKVTSKSVLEYYNSRINSLNASIKEFDVDIEKQFLYISEQNKNKIPKKFKINFPWLIDASVPARLLELSESRFYYQLQLFDIYKAKAKYYSSEEFFNDLDSDSTYKSYKKINSKTFLSLLKSGDSLADDYLKLLIKSNYKALKYYNLATDSLGDYSSNIYQLKKMQAFFNPIPLKLVKKGNDYDLIINAINDNKRFRERYFSNRVKPYLHNLKGVVYYQLANLFKYSKMDWDFIALMLDNAEKEYFIALGVDYSYVNVVLDIAKLYLWRYENSNEYNSEYLLGKIDVFFRNYFSKNRNSKEVVIENLLGNKINKKVYVAMSLADQIDFLFVLAKSYYYIAFLHIDDIKKLKVFYPALFDNLQNISDYKSYFLKKSIYVYEKLLIKNKLNKGSEYYNKAFDNVNNLYSLLKI